MSKIIPIHSLPDPSCSTPRALRLTDWPVLGAVLRQGWLMTCLRVVTLALLMVALASGLVLEDARVGLSVLLLWGVFWPLATSVLTPSLGNAFCAVCPHGFVGKWLTRIGLRRRFPKRLRGVWLGLIALLLGYWVMAYAMPGFLSGSTRATAWYFLLFTACAFVVFYVFKDMAWCKHVCPLGRVLAAHGRIGILKIETERDACAECRSFDCVKACSYRLAPFRFEARNDMGACTLCTDCVTACDHAHLSVRRPGRALQARISGQHGNEAWVFILILAVAGVGIQFMHGLGHTALAPYLPWRLVGEWLQTRLPFAAETFDVGRLLALFCALAVTVLAAIWSYGRVAQRLGMTWQASANALACGLAPLAIIGLIPHAVMRFTTQNAHALVNDSGALLGLGWSVSPLAKRGDMWLSWLSVLPYFAMAWTLWLLWQRAALLTADARLRWQIWLIGSMPAWLYIGVFALKLAAQWWAPGATAHGH